MENVNNVFHVMYLHLAGREFVSHQLTEPRHKIATTIVFAIILVGTRDGC